jgi:hypothetical protein
VTPVDADKIIALETEGWRALTTEQAAQHYRACLTDDAVMAFEFGTMDRDDAIAAIAASPPWSWFDIQRPRVIVLSSSSAIVVYRVTAARDGESPYSALICSAFRRDADRWRLAYHQQTPLPPESAVDT